jgi:hopanoid biosynthesis associated protein HpnK
VRYCGRAHHFNSQSSSVKKLIVTADDFGLSLPLNEAVEKAHTQGILTATSLMMGAPYCDDAIARARRLPKLGVGLHLTLVDGRPVLPPDEIPNLVGADGRFSKNPVKFGIALFFSAKVRQQAEAEITAQFEKFRRTGLPLDHVNAHQHFHMHPVVSNMIAKMAPSFGRPGVRIPVEPFASSYAAMSDRPVGRFFSQWFFGIQSHRLRRGAIDAGLPVNDHVFGLNDSGAMVEQRVLRLLDHLPDGISELYFHPATRRWAGADNLPESYKPVEEFSALTSEATMAKISDLGLSRVSFREAFAEARNSEATDA